MKAASKKSEHPSPPLLTARAALFLDFDGTLTEIAQRPDLVVVAESLPDLLRRLYQSLEGAVAVLSGRRLSAVDDLLGPILTAGAGVHGAELRLSSGGSVNESPAASIAELARHLHDKFQADTRIVVEDKGAAVALHYRQAPERQQDCVQAMIGLVGLNTGIEVLQGRMVVEARVRGVNKGEALRALMASGTFQRRVPVVVGDDITDEDAFVVVNELKGWSVRVGEGSSEARYRLDNVTAVHDWLEQSLRKLEKQ